MCAGLSVYPGQKVAGSYAGQQFAVGQNALDTTEAPTRIFDIDFAGRRITAE